MKDPRIVREIEEAAEKLLEENPYFDWGYEVAMPERNSEGLWIVPFRWLPTDGSVIDGTGFILVDHETKAARFNTPQDRWIW